MSQQLYVIDVRNKMLQRWHALGEEYPEAMQELKEFLRKHPTNIYAKKDIAKKLRGDLKGIYQYDVSYKVRWSPKFGQVGMKNLVVTVVFAKGHP